MDGLGAGLTRGFDHTRRSEEHTSELQSLRQLVCRLLLEKKKLKPHPPLDRAAFVRPIAHRGWHDKAKGRLENTAPAFRAAIEKGYGMECDLQGVAYVSSMVLHNANHHRLVSVSGPISPCSLCSLARLRYKGQNEGMLSFVALLELVGGRLPLVVDFFFNDTPTPEIYTLSLHDALPI